MTSLSISLSFPTGLSFTRELRRVEPSGTAVTLSTPYYDRTMSRVREKRSLPPTFRGAVCDLHNTTFLEPLDPVCALSDISLERDPERRLITNGSAALAYPGRPPVTIEDATKTSNEQCHKDGTNGHFPPVQPQQDKHNPTKDRNIPICYAGKCCVQVL